MKTDIEIAQEAAMIPIKEVAASYGISEEDLELYGRYKAKLTDELWEEVKDRPDGKLVLVTASTRLRPERERPRPRSDWAKRLERWTKRPSSRCVSRP